MAISQSFIMAGYSVPLALTPKPYCRISARVSSHSKTLAFLRLEKSHPRNLSSSSSSSSSSRSYSNTRLNAAGLSEIEPDLSEEARDRWATNGISPDEFIYGEYDGHHTYHEGHEGQEGTFWEGVMSEYTAAEPPSGFQGIMSWLFLPAMAAGFVYHVPGEYLYIGAAVFVVIFCAIEMGKPDKPHNFEPQIYNMERGARDKLIADYNSMDIWDFNEKYGDLWDFTVKRDDIVR